MLWWRAATTLFPSPRGGECSTWMSESCRYSRVLFLQRFLPKCVFPPVHNWAPYLWSSLLSRSGLTVSYISQSSLCLICPARMRWSQTCSHKSKKKTLKIHLRSQDHPPPFFFFLFAFICWELQAVWSETAWESSHFFMSGVEKEKNRVVLVKVVYRVRIIYHSFTETSALHQTPVMTLRLVRTRKFVFFSLCGPKTGITHRLVSPNCSPYADLQPG